MSNTTNLNVPNLIALPEESELTRRGMMSGMGAVVVSASASPLVGPKLSRGKTCEHIIAFFNAAASANAFAIEVRGRNAATRIVAASAPANWTVALDYPNSSVIFRPTGGGIIPVGTPLPGKFSISVLDNGQPNKLADVRWLGKGRSRVLCDQTLRVDCPTDREAGAPAPRQGQTQLPAPGPAEKRLPAPPGAQQGKMWWPDKEPIPPKFCGCVWAETESDPYSQQFTSPEINVTVLSAVSAGLHKVLVKYEVELVPANLPVDRVWTVTDDEENVVTASVSDNLTGDATFTLPGPGAYTFNLALSSSKECSNYHFFDKADAPSEDDEDDYTVMGGTSVIEATLVDPCDPKTYRFKDSSTPKGLNPQWSVTDFNSTVTQLTADTNGEAVYTFPVIGQTYVVTLKAQDLDEQNVFVDRPPATKSMMPAITQDSVDFTFEYNSCGAGGYLTTFKNLSTLAQCPVAWEWDFQDGPTSNQLNPTHNYQVPGTYMVTLKMTSGATVITKQKLVVITHWAPQLVWPPKICPDGQVYFTATYPTNAVESKWEFKNGTPSVRSDSNAAGYASEEVCSRYGTAGVHVVKLTAKNANNGVCTVGRDFSISAIMNFKSKCRWRKVHPFDYKGKHYHLVKFFKAKGKKGKIKVKTMLRRKYGPIYLPKKAHYIKASFYGQVTIQSGTSPCWGATWDTYAEPNYTTERSDKSKAKVKATGLSHFRLGQGLLRSNHEVKVDANHTGVVAGLNLWSSAADHCDSSAQASECP